MYHDKLNSPTDGYNYTPINGNASFQELMHNQNASFPKIPLYIPPKENCGCSKPSPQPIPDDVLWQINNRASYNK